MAGDEVSFEKRDQGLACRSCAVGQFGGQAKEA
jgi:hypothetical protein